MIMLHAYKLPMVISDNKRVLLKDRDILHFGDIKVEAILVPGHTWGHMVYLVDDEYLFTGDTIWFGADGGYSFINVLAEDNDLSISSLKKLQNLLKTENCLLRSSLDTPGGRMIWILCLPILIRYVTA